MTNTLSSYRWAPRSLDDFRREIGRFADGLFHESASPSVFAPSVDFAETETGFEISVDLPGATPNDVQVEFKDGHLWITGERSTETEEKGKTYHRIERRTGSFRRVIAIGNEVDAENVTAAYKDGVLKVIVPKAAAAQPKRIEIKT